MATAKQGEGFGGGIVVHLTGVVANGLLINPVAAPCETCEN